MPKSISKAQAEALAEGFLDSIGSKEGLRPKESLSALFRLAGELAEEAQNNLNKVDRVSSGALSSSIEILNPERRGGVIAVDISLLFYYKFIDQGVKGTRNSAIASPYSFKNEFPSKKMIRSIRKWIIKEGLKAKTNVGGPSITKRERKRKSITDTSNQTAYAISRAVKQKGLKRTLFWTNAVKKIESISEKKLGDAFILDIIESIPSKI